MLVLIMIGVIFLMVYIGMFFSWFVWYVEDYELYSFNYLYIGVFKIWYVVFGDVVFVFEEVVRVYGYGGQFNV